jgi:hypothetical protein
MKAKLGEYKGNPTITLNPGAKYPFTFGIDKARIILENLDDIRAFVASAPGKPVNVYFTHANGGKGKSQYPTREAAEAGMVVLRAAGFECSTGSQEAAGIKAEVNNGIKAIAADIIRHVNGGKELAR